MPFGVTEYRCNSSRVWSGRPARSLILCPCFEAHFPCFIPDVRSILYHAVCVICSLVQRTSPNLNVEFLKGTILTCLCGVWLDRVLKQRFLPPVGPSDMCDSVYRRFGSWASRSQAFLEEDTPHCLSWASRPDRRNVHLNQENFPMSELMWLYRAVLIFKIVTCNSTYFIRLGTSRCPHSGFPITHLTVQMSPKRLWAWTLIREKHSIAVHRN